MNNNPLTIIAPSPTHRQFEAVANACVLFARLATTLDNLRASILGNINAFRHSLSSAVHSCVETTYFLIIFLCHFLIIQLSNHNTHPLKTLFISTFTHWLESILRHLVQLIDCPELARLLSICALHSVYLTYVFTFLCQDLDDLF